MDASVEMKIQVLNEMLVQRKQLLELSNNLGMYCGYDAESSIVIYDTDEFFQYAKILEAEVKESDYKPEAHDMRVHFSYQGFDFNAYLLKEEVKKYADRIVFLPEESSV